MKELRPYPTVRHTGKRGKVADGHSVKVIADGAVAVHELAYAQGFFGMVTAIKDKDTGDTGKREGVAGDEITLTIEQAQYETKQIDEGADYKVGTVVYWDDDAKKVVQTDTPYFIGRVTRTKTSGGAIWILLAPQQHVIELINEGGQ